MIRSNRPVYSLTNYMLLGRTLYYVPYLSMIHPGRVISTFVGLDVIVEILTGNGAAKVANLSNSPEQINIGNGLIRASLLLQILLFALFISLEIVFHTRLVKAGIMTPKMQAIVALLYGSSALILIRNIYRCIEVWQGYTGYLQRHEAFFYVFDAGLMLVNTIMLNIWHPAQYLPGSNKVYLARDGVTELEGPGWVDTRPWWVTMFDPFDVVGLIKGKDKETAFWENEEVQGDRVRPKEVGDA